MLEDSPCVFSCFFCRGIASDTRFLDKTTFLRKGQVIIDPKKFQKVKVDVHFSGPKDWPFSGCRLPGCRLRQWLWRREGFWKLARVIGVGLICFLLQKWKLWRFHSFCSAKLLVSDELLVNVGVTSSCFRSQKVDKPGHKTMLKLWCSILIANTDWWLCCHNFYCPFFWDIKCDNIWQPYFSTG